MAKSKPTATTVQLVSNNHVSFLPLDTIVEMVIKRVTPQLERKCALLQKQQYKQMRAVDALEKAIMNKQRVQLLRKLRQLGAASVRTSHGGIVSFNWAGIRCNLQVVSALSSTELTAARKELNRTCAAMNAMDTRMWKDNMVDNAHTAVLALLKQGKSMEMDKLVDAASAKLLAG